MNQIYKKSHCSIQKHQITDLLFLLFIYPFSTSYGNEQFSFDSRFLPSGYNYSLNSNLPPEGEYLVDIYINKIKKESAIIPFYIKGNKLVPCLSKEKLSSLGININNNDNTECVETSKAGISNISFEFSSLRLFIAVPKNLLSEIDKISSKDIDNGIHALFFNYQVNTRLANNKNRYDYISVSPNINYFSWRLRNLFEFNQNNDEKTWERNYTYLEKSFYDKKLNLVVGESYTNSNVYNNYSFTGISVSTDTDMYTPSEIDYTPEIHGVADSDSQIIVRQGNTIIINESVPAGPFSFPITNLMYTGGQLNVEITDIYGNKKQYTVSNSSLPVMRKAGLMVYNFISGKLTKKNSEDGDFFTQGDINYGTHYNSTLFGGYQFSKNYFNLSTGIGTDLGFSGAWLLHVSRSNFKNKNGYNINLQQNTQLRPFNAGVNFDYAYRKKGYVELSDIGWHGNLYNQLKNSFSLSLSKSLDKYGNFSLDYNKMKYWDNAYDSNSMSIRYFFKFMRAMITTNCSLNKYQSYEKKDKRFSINISLPLTKDYGYISSNYSFSNANTGTATSSVGLNGSFFNDARLNWNIQQNRTTRNNGYTDNTSYIATSYASPYGVFTGSYSGSNKYSSQFYSASGGIVLHSDGVAFTQKAGDTSALVRIDNISDIKIGNTPGVYTGYNGFALIPHLQPFKKNTILINDKGIPDGIALANIKKQVIPSRGAIVKVKFDAKKGNDILFKLTTKDGKTPPLGAIAHEKNGKQVNTGIVDDDGMLYMSGLSGTGIINVTWNGKVCSFPFSEKDISSKQLSVVNKQC
ncbi:fimbrial biogenesis outer membrane usher protein [Escherichia coli]|uniref:Outer membrane usher protein CssD n=2 Tax=Escherichia coli TaxID=562 RepID=A0A0S3PN25_ECOLX|nr:fimbrial biogenesis outer membrane usher protein [Escherichia coli]EFW7498429.1 fimbrial biogenesis outer membrane usher protein [Shigella sonnei]EMW28505.1 type VII secretion system (T7SS), usher family protein [Escherichia coli 2845650]ESS90776.1 putative outer membrane usher protein yraJ precursor [Escherichia coli CE516]EZB22462.1 fimbrial protein [Escherichia coli O169:H41 str. F9792]BAT57113.1 outer membrane usher protein CssD [Escherichia coli O169:H41]